MSFAEVVMWVICAAAYEARPWATEENYQHISRWTKGPQGFAWHEHFRVMTWESSTEKRGDGR